MTLAEVFNPSMIKVGLESDDKDELFEEMVQVIVDADSSISRDKILQAIEQRESLMSTGIMHDVAVPHGRSDAVKDIVGCIGISKKGIDYDSLDSDPVHMVFMLIYAPSFGESSLQIFKKLATILGDASFRNDTIHHKHSVLKFDVEFRF